MCQRQIGEQIFSYKGGWVPNMLGETPLHPKLWNPSQHPAQLGAPSWLNLSPARVATGISLPLTFPLASKARGPNIQVRRKRVTAMLGLARGCWFTAVLLQDLLSRPEPQGIFPLLPLLQSTGLKGRLPFFLPSSGTSAEKGFLVFSEAAHSLH